MAEPSSQPPLDPLTLWREWAAQAEEQWNRYFNQIMGSETFAAMGRSLEAMFALQQRLAQQFEAVLKAWNLPTRSDIAALGERLAHIEQRLDEIAARLAGEESAARTAG